MEQENKKELEIDKVHKEIIVEK